jgi:hypothetical protein
MLIHCKKVMGNIVNQILETEVNNISYKNTGSHSELSNIKFLT